MKKLILLSCLSFLLVQIGVGQQSTENLTIEKEQPRIYINNTSNLKWSSSGIALRNLNSSTQNYYYLFTEKTDINNLGNSSFIIRKNTPNGFLNAFYISDSDNKLIFNGHKTTTESYGDIIFHNGNVGIGTTSPVSALDVRASTKGLFVLSSSESSNEYILRAKSGTTDKFTVNGNGEVGIGTISPDAKLDIENNEGDGFLFNSEFAIDKTKLVFKENNTEIFSFFYDGSAAAPNNKLHIKDEYFGNEIITFLQQSGNVGIGTTGPLDKFHVRTDVAYTTEGIYARFDGGDGNRGLEFGQAVNGTNSRAYIQSRYNMTSVYGLLLNPYGGNVGVGCTDPQHKLDVAGTIRAHEVIVEIAAPAPDYVFEEDYNLRSLTEVESFVKENKHLPDVPAGESMEENGIGVAEMNMLLLKKVEELTLYVIDLKKEVEELKKKQVSE